MISLILSLFSNWKLILGGVVALAISLFVLDWQHRGAEITSLTAQNSTLQQDLAVEKQKEALAAAAQVVLDARTTAAGKERGLTNALANKASGAPASENAGVAPVLRDTLSGLRGLHISVNSGKKEH
jgi:hypothetical protein